MHKICQIGALTDLPAFLLGAAAAYAICAVPILSDPRSRIPAFALAQIFSLAIRRFSRYNNKARIDSAAPTP